MVGIGFGAEWYKTLIAALFGWILSSLSQHLLVRRQRREAIKRALSDLLEIRHQLIASDAVFAKLREMIPIPPEAEAQFAPWIEQFVLPNADALSKRFDESVSLIASIDPILGFRLRSKDLMRPLLQRLAAVLSQNAQAAILGPGLAWIPKGCIGSDGLTETGTGEIGQENKVAHRRAVRTTVSAIHPRSVSMNYRGLSGTLLGVRTLHVLHFTLSDGFDSHSLSPRVRLRPSQFLGTSRDGGRSACRLAQV